MAWRLIRLRPILAPRPVQTEHLPPRAEPQGFSTSRALTPIHDDLETERDLYRRFLSGENLSDDEEDFSPRHPSVAPESDGEDSDSVQGSPVEEDIEQLAATAMSSASASHLLAHMSSPQTTLTRRRYSRVQAGEEHEPQSQADAWDRFVEEKRLAVRSRQDEGSEGRRLCVICTCEERQIICWPCR